MVMYIIETNQLTRDEYEAAFETILSECESRDTVDTFVKLENFEYDGWYENPPSYYEACQIFKRKYGISYHTLMYGYVNKTGELVFDDEFYVD